MLVGETSVGKLSWIKGVYRQPRVSARYVNEYINHQFVGGNVQEWQSIALNNGEQAKVYLIPGLLQATGQFGHIGLGAKNKEGEKIVYEAGGLPVVYLDNNYADNPVVRANEQYKVNKWEEQKVLLGKNGVKPSVDS